MDRPADRRTADIITEIANTIDPSIVMVSEVPSDHPELGNCLPVLDTQVCLNSEGRILYKFYEKPVASPVLLQAGSAMNDRTRRAILTQEGVRRLINTSLEYSKEVKDEILSTYMQKLHNSGYDQQFRKEILLSVKNAFNKIVTKHESGEKPIHRDREFKKEERRKEKNNKVKSWYRKGDHHDSVMFVPITPGSVLKGRIQKRLESGQFNIKLVEFTGPKISEIVKQRVGDGSQD